MKIIFGLFLIVAVISAYSFKDAEGVNKVNSVYDFKAKAFDGKEISLAEYKGKVLLIVNVASKCGFTKQYEGLEKLYDKYNSKGLVILGFPCNQFRNQEPGTDSEIIEFCKLNYGINFPMFSKIDVNGENAHPLYKFLIAQKSGVLSDSIKWNFTKFLIDRKGAVAERFAPQITPESIESKIEALLGK